MNFLQSFRQHAATPSRKSKPKVPEFIYRDELISKTAAPTKVKKKVHFESKPLLQSDQNPVVEIQKDHEIAKSVAVNGEKSGIHVKILMTKEEAARLLSKCKNGGILELKDVANELVQIRRDLVSVVSCASKDE